MTQHLLFCDVLWAVKGRAFAVSHDGAFINDLCSNAGHPSPTKERGVVRWVGEANVVKQRTTGDVNVGVGVGNFGVLGQDARGHFAQSSNDLEVLILGAETLAKGKLYGGARVF